MKNVLTGLSRLSHFEHSIHMPRSRPQTLQDFRLLLELHETAPQEEKNPCIGESGYVERTIQSFGEIWFLQGAPKKSMFCHLVHE
jgi:hypothetical protein